MNSTIDSPVRNAKEGNLKAFEQLYIKYKDKVYALALATLKNAGEAEEVTRHTFIRAYEQLDTLRDENAFDLWIQYIALCESNGVCRLGSSPVDEHEADNNNAERIEDDFFVPQDYIERCDLSYRLTMIIDRLPTIRRQTLILSLYDKLSVSGIAQIMNCSEDDVISRICYTKGYIKNELEKHEHEAGEQFSNTTLIPFDNIYTFLIHSSVMSASTAADIWKDIREYIKTANADRTKQKKTPVAVKAAIAASIATIFICAGIVTVLLTGPTFSAKKAAATEPAETTAVTEAAQAPAATAAPATEAQSIPDPEPAPAIDPEPEEQTDAASDIDSEWLSQIAGTYYVPRMAGYTNITLTIEENGTLTERTFSTGAQPFDDSTSAEIISVNPVDSTVCRFETTPDFTYYDTNGSYNDSFKATYYSSETPIASIPSSMMEYLTNFSYIDLTGETLGIPVIATDKGTYYIGSSNDS